ncbi:MAG: hypothetical protein LBB94_07425 [Clostridiales bacterium]|nr:hypothetical protein [Clostridiales bacterium]
MRKFFISCLLLFLCACGGNVNTDITPTVTTTASALAEDDVRQDPVAFPSGEYENPFGDAGTRFTLTAAQQALFDSYSKDFNFDISLFKDASPVDVAQVFVECGIEGLWEGEYNLYYFETRRVAKADYKADFEKDLSTLDIRTRRDQANLVFPYLKDGVFVEESDGSGYIEFESMEQTSDYETLYKVKTKMNLKKVDGVWKIDQNNMFTSE